MYIKHAEKIQKNIAFSTTFTMQKFFMKNAMDLAEIAFESCSVLRQLFTSNAVERFSGNSSLLLTEYV